MQYWGGETSGVRENFDTSSGADTPLKTLVIVRAKSSRVVLPSRGVRAVDFPVEDWRDHARRGVERGKQIDHD